MAKEKSGNKKYKVRAGQFVIDKEHYGHGSIVELTPEQQKRAKGHFGDGLVEVNVKSKSTKEDVPDEIVDNRKKAKDAAKNKNKTATESPNKDLVPADEDQAE